jgi:DUF4097 and DUF4098 domain-containing protein YvlB
MKRRRFWIFFLILVEILLCVSIVSSVWWGISNLQSGNLDIRALHVDRTYSEADEEWSFKLDGKGELVVDSSAGRVDILAGEGDEVIVQAHKKAWHSSKAKAEAALEEMQVSVTQQGNVINVYFEQPEKVIIGGSIRSDTVDFTILVPSEMTISVTTGFGDITLEGTIGDAILKSEFGEVEVRNVEGGLEVSSNSGKLTARDIQSGQEQINIKTEFGDISLEKATAGQVILHSNSGKLVLQDVHASGDITLESEFGRIEFQIGAADDLTVESNSGELALRDLDVAGDLVARSEFGDIRLELVSAASYDLDTNSGSINVEYAIGAIKAHSGFGGIEVTQAEDAQLDLRTNSGSIEFSGFLGQGPHVVETEFGNIHLFLPEDTALDVDLETEFGKLQCDFPLMIIGEQDKNHWRGTINGGGVELHAKTNSGTVTLEVLGKQ